MKVDLNRFRQTFFQESAEHVNSMESGLLALQPGSQDLESLNAIFRAIHSIKGGSATFAFDALTHFAHRLEERLDSLRSGKIYATAETIQLLLQSCDTLRNLLADAQEGRDSNSNAEELLERLAAVHPSQEHADQIGGEPRGESAGCDSAKGKVTYEISFQPSPEIFRQGMDPIAILRDLASLGELAEIKPDLSQLPSLQDLEPDRCYLAWNARLTTERGKSDVQDVFAFVEEGAQITIRECAASDAASANSAKSEKRTAPRFERRAMDSSSIRVSTEKVDQLIDLVGELVIAQSMASEIMKQVEADRMGELKAAFCEVGRNTRELQEQVMSIRMLPVGTVFARLPRIVHDVANSSGKSIQLETTGEETELDKSVLEGLVDPLTHLIRNAVDHGIETPEERVLLGKSETGTVRVQARHEGGSFIIEISDDGRGLDIARIREKAIRQGLMSAGDDLAPEQIRAFVFHPGFSTAAAVTEVSGRGVGMDVVRRNVEGLGGVVGLQSKPGLGTTVSIRLPLTLAMMEGQLVRVGELIYVLPLTSMVESVRPSPDQVLSVMGKEEVVIVRGDPVPLLRLHQLFGIQNAIRDAWVGLVVIIENKGRRFALLVDELLGQQQIVIKNLQENFRKIQGTLGATILGNGRVSLILDVSGLVELARATPKLSLHSTNKKQVIAAPPTISIMEGVGV